METYNINFDYLKDVFNDMSQLYISSYEQPILLFSMLVILLSVFFISRKVLKLEKIQFNDIDDITSFSRLIDEELGILKKQQDDLSHVINNPEVKIKADDDTNSDGKLFNNAPYSQAVQLARRGYAREDIISLCSLTESEAELILALHSNTRAA